MTKTSMDLSELLAKHDQGGFLRNIAEAVLQLLWGPTSKASSAPDAMNAAAIGQAEREAKRFAGVVAFRQIADDETGEVLDEPMILARHGELPSNMADE
ncbi:hypothetical protein SAMN06297251_112121 [Fulvimarina manganoxydans]|uniref:Uncharacterized protein n=1 Tax=Fulvimarina manganoxydans TaxID=937218 RepID=A0A1W2D3W1_9HYPH|nr:hypothetical protein SAMN06297251_112121 [Fulvimarina manganoxydans]